MAAEHVIRLRDMRARVGDEESWKAECSCGWAGVLYEGRTGQNAARREGKVHVEDCRPERRPA